MHTGLDEFEVGEATRDVGELSHLSRSDDAVDLHVRGVDLDAVGVNVDNFCARAGGELHRFNVFLVDGQDDTGGGEGLETRSRGRDGVGADGELREEVAAVLLAR